MFEFYSRNGRTVSRSELENYNRTLKNLAQNSLGRNSAAVNIEKELAGAESLQRAADRIRGGVAGLARAAANAGSSSVPQSTSVSGRRYSCQVTCTTSAFAASTGVVGESARSVQVTISAPSRSAARSQAQSNRSQICKGQGLFEPVGGAVSCQ